MYLNSLYILYFYMILRKQMNRTNSLIILVAIILGTFLVFNITTIPMINVSASGEDQEEQEYYYPPEPEEYYYPPLMDGYDPSELPEYIPRESYGDGSYDHYESGYYEEQGYGIPYDIK